MLGLGLPAALTAMYTTTLNFAPLWVWMFGINAMLFGLMGKDKFAASRKGAARTPEITLYTLTLLGGTPALFLGRYLFRHKTKKETFNNGLYAVLVAQAIGIWYFWSTLKSWM